LRDKSNKLIQQAEQLLIESLKLPPLEELPLKQYNGEYAVQNFSLYSQQLDNRFEARYHQPLTNSIVDCLAHNAADILPLGHPDLSKNTYIPNRFKRIYVADETDGVPFFSGKCLLELDPSNKKYISRTFHKDRIGKQLIIKKGMLLVTCSGTTGNVNLVPEHWHNWVMTHDIIRIIPADEDVSGYLYCWLNSEYGNTLIKRNDYGAVVPHIECEHINKVPVPILKNKEAMMQINRLVLDANKLRSESYYLEQAAINQLNSEVIFASPL
jgi:type I restriction enzyme S subunit